jgi:hypothetical protein
MFIIFLEEYNTTTVRISAREMSSDGPEFFRIITIFLKFIRKNFFLANLIAAVTLFFARFNSCQSSCKLENLAFLSFWSRDLISSSSSGVSHFGCVPCLTRFFLSGI